MRLDPRCGLDGAWPAALIAAAEPTYKFAAIKRSIKYSCYKDMARMGRRELASGAIFTALLAVLYLRPLKSGGRSPTMQGIRRSRR